MRRITDEELQILLDNINENMKRYNDDINIKMEQSDRTELDHMRYQKANNLAYSSVYAKFNTTNEV